MKTDIAQFIPFVHENFEFKKNLIQAARDQDKTALPGLLSATLIYVNTVDYLAYHILENLRMIVYLTTYNELGAIVFYEGKNERKDEPLGNVISELKNYSFPDKEGFLEDLNDFNELRKRYVHNFLKIAPKDVERADRELIEVINISERIISKYDKITQGIRDGWNSYLSRLSATSKTTIPITPTDNSSVEEPNKKEKQTK